MPLHNPVWEILEPYFVKLGVYTNTDPTYGRWTLPSHPGHAGLINNPGVIRRYRRIFLPPYGHFRTLQEAFDSTEIIHSEDVEVTQQEIQTGLERGGRWVFYSTWEMKEEPKGGWEGGGRGKGSDVVMVHGLSDYGLRYAPHVEHFLKAGFRVILPDLPAYGRSTGINSYLPSLLLLPSALHACLTDLARDDLTHKRTTRKVFLCGASMGGWTVLYYLLKYPPNASANVAANAALQDIPPPPKGHGVGYHGAERPRSDEKSRVRVSGAFVLCPAVEVSKDSRPWLITEMIGRSIKYFAGTLPLAKSIRGKTSSDPRVEEDFFADVLCYHGLLRVATGLSLLEGMTELEKRAEEIDVPIRLVHGSADRVTSHLGTVRLFDRLPNHDKEIEIYEDYEHIMLKVGIDEADDEKRQRILANWREWLLQRC